MEKLSKRALGCMYVAALCVTLVVVGIVVALNVFWFVPEKLEIATIVSIIVAGLQVVNALVSPYFRFHRYRYSIGEDYIDIREGYIFVERNIVPVERLHKMQTMRGPIDRMFKVAKVVVTTAGGDVTIRFLDEEKADFIAEQLSRRINEIVVEQREEDGE